MGPNTSLLVDAQLVQAPVPRTLVVLAVLRSLAAAGLALLLYALAPVRAETAVVALATAMLGIVVLGGVFLSQLRRIMRSARPVSLAIETLTFVAVLFVALFALMYTSLSAGYPGSFNEPIDKVAGLYFAMSILSTVGFGDISAVSDGARIAVTVHMVLNLVLFGTALKLITSATRAAVRTRATTAAIPPPGGAEQPAPGPVG